MPACMRTWRSVSHARSSWRSCSGACTHAAMETVRAARMCARAPGDAPAVRSAISWRGCSTQRLWSMHTRCHGDNTQPLACVRACAPDDQQPCSSHTRPTAASNEQKLRSDRNFLAWCRTRAPEGAAWRCRGIVAWREQVCGGQTIYGHHFPAARVSARAHSRVKACLCTCAGKPGAPLSPLRVRWKLGGA